MITSYLPLRLRDSADFTVLQVLRQHAQHGLARDASAREACRHAQQRFRFLTVQPRVTTERTLEIPEEDLIFTACRCASCRSHLEHACRWPPAFISLHASLPTRLKHTHH